MQLLVDLCRERRPPSFDLRACVKYTGPPVISHEIRLLSPCFPVISCLSDDSVSIEGKVIQPHQPDGRRTNRVNRWLFYSLTLYRGKQTGPFVLCKLLVVLYLYVITRLIRLSL